MHVTVIGVGYVGLCTGVGLALKGHNVTGITTTADKAVMINDGKSPIFEEGLELHLKECLSKGTFRSTINIDSAVKAAEVIFICVGTPSSDDGKINLSQIKSASISIGQAFKNTSSYKAIIVKSTVVPGTTEEVVLPLIEEYSEKKVGIDFGLGMNPEFLREGKAMDDFLNPDRIVIGSYDEKSASTAKKIYNLFNAPIIETDIQTAEMIKYASNSFLATKISFMNELGNLCKKLKIDTYEVAKGMGLDSRISPHFLQAGIGYGGSCFPKDTKALIFKARETDSQMRILEYVEEINYKQRFMILDMLKSKMNFDLKEKNIAILGLAFKAGTDDMRDSPSIDIINELHKQGARIKAYDPQAIINAKKIMPFVQYLNSPQEVLRNADACLVLTEWPEFSALTDEDFNLMADKIVMEGRKILDPQKVSGYEGVCW